MVPSVTGHQEGSHLSLTWVVVPILFSLGDVSTDVANPFRAGDGDRTRDKSLEGSHVTATPHPQVGSYMGEEVVVVSPNAQRLR